MQREPFVPDLQQILAPVPGDTPCGPSLRYDPAFLALRQARSEDDPSLPMRDWERPLQKADWRGIANSCVAMLAKSKDLQLAAWLCDAWVRQHQVEGLIAGVRLLNGMVAAYWDGLHPLIEDGDSDARIAPFVWMNESLPLVLRLHVPLMFLADRKPPTLNLADWDQSIIAGTRDAKAAKEAPLMREALIASVDERSLLWLVDLQAQLQLALDEWEKLAKGLDERLALDAPSIAKVADTLRKLQRACVSLQDGRSPRGASAPEPAATPDTEPEPESNADHSEEPPMPAAAPAKSAARTQGAPLPSGPITSREDAYRMLEAAAAYLERTEPHSPTPYLVKRAVSWGQMSLADLMQEIVREEGDLNRYFSLLGMNQQQE